MRSLTVEALAVRAMRNLAAVDIELGPRFNVFAGDNGQGKTNLLEAVYVLCSSRSFRAAKPGDLVAHGADIASVRGAVSEDGDRREQSVGVKPGARLVRIDAKRPATLAEYAVRTPVVVFHPGAVALSQGSGGERRKLLDRVALYLDPASLAEAESFTRALRERQRALDVRGVGARDLDQWEELIVRHGASLSRARARAASLLAERALHAFSRIGAPELSLVVRYAPGGPDDPDAFRAELERRRAADLRRGSATVGPHRDDLELLLDGHGVRGVASQGQHRAIVLSLKLAEIDVVGEARGVRPILLLDDVSSELDRARTAALFGFLGDLRGQVFLTTTRRELIDTGESGHVDVRRDFAVDTGRITRVA